MIYDTYNTFAKQVALNTGAPATFNVGNTIDLGVAGRDIGNGRPVYLFLLVTTTVTGTSSTVQFQVASDSVDPLLVNATQSIHLQTLAIPEATLVAGYNRMWALPLEGSVPYERYLGLQQVTGVAALTAGAVTAFLTLDPHGNKSYPDAVN